MRVLVLDLVCQLGVQWSPTEQQRQLFPLCVQVQAQLRARHGEAYTTLDVSQVPEGYAAEAKEIIFAEFSTHCERS